MRNHFNHGAEPTIMISQTFPDSPEHRANSVSLLHCWHIRVGLFRDLEVSRIRDYSLFFQTSYLEPYFQRLNKRIKNTVGIDPGTVKKIKARQKKLTTLFKKLNDRRDLKVLEDFLEEYTWFEHRVLHVDLLNTLTQLEFNVYMQEEAEWGRVFLRNLNSWHDKYWELK